MKHKLWRSESTRINRRSCQLGRAVYLPRLHSRALNYDVEQCTYAKLKIGQQECDISLQEQNFDSIDATQSHFLI